MAQIDPVAFNAALRKLDAPADCGALFARVIAPYGFDTFASGEIDLAVRDRSAFHLIGWPDSWRQFYMSSSLIDHDPIVEEIAHRSEPFTWSDLRASRTLSRVGTKALETAAEAGWVEGLIVPIPQASGRIGLVSMAGHRDCTDPQERGALGVISILLHSHVRTLVGRHGFAVPPAKLTEREVQAVRCVARGLSDAEIGRELGVAASTAHEFVEKAKRKMRVHSRAELAAMGGSYGFVDL